MGPRADARGVAPGAAFRGFERHGPLRFRGARTDSQRRAGRPEGAAGGAEGRPLSTEAGRLLRKIERLGAMEEWRSFTLSPQDWAERLRALRGMFRPARPSEDPPSHERRSNGAAKRRRSTCSRKPSTKPPKRSTPGATMQLEEFWRAVKSVLRLKPLRLDDGRRNVVHVLSAPEAREWELPVIFVCGMTEKQFPLLHRQDPFFPDDARRRLQDAGIRVRTAAEFEREERALFDSAISRATMLVTLSYPECDARGEATLPSLFLEDLGLVAESGAGAPAGQPAAARRSAPLRSALPRFSNCFVGKPRWFRPRRSKPTCNARSSTSAARRCASRRAPARPEERLDFMTQGSIVHDTLAAWYAHPQDIAPLFESVFEAALEEKRIPPGYHVERLRNAMLEDLQAFAQDGRWPRAAFESRTEQEFEFALETVGVRGKIDRLEWPPGGRAYVIDYKYSAAQRTRTSPGRCQPACRRNCTPWRPRRPSECGPAGMFYVGLKGGVDYAGWSDEAVGDLTAEPIPERWLEDAETRTLRVVEEIRSGRVEAAPSNPENCRLLRVSRRVPRQSGGGDCLPRLPRRRSHERDSLHARARPPPSM